MNHIAADPVPAHATLAGKAAPTVEDLVVLENGVCEIPDHHNVVLVVGIAAEYIALNERVAVWFAAGIQPERIARSYVAVHQSETGCS